MIAQEPGLSSGKRPRERLQWWRPLKAPGLLFAGFGMCLALGNPLASPGFHQRALEEACGQTGGLQGPLETTPFSVCLEYPGPWPLAALAHRGCPSPSTVAPLTGQTPAGVVQNPPQGSHSSVNGPVEKEASGTVSLSF